MEKKPKFSLGQRVVVKFSGEVEGEKVEVFKNMRVTGIKYEDIPGSGYDTIRKFFYRVTSSDRWVPEESVVELCIDQ